LLDGRLSFNLRSCFLFQVAKRLDAIMRGFDVAFAFDASQRNLLSRDPLRVFDVTLLRLVDYDSLKLFLFIEKVGYIKKRIALESDADCMPGKTRMTRPL
jgi:hypothetical protein